MSLFNHAKSRLATVRPQWILIAGFAVAILIGAILLLLPCASRPGSPPPAPVDALFTATSATCVTGLTVLDVEAQFSLFGKLVILLLIQIGGLGIMTFGTFLLVLMGRRMSVRNESLLASSLGGGETPNLRGLLNRTITFTILFEFCGATLLAWRHWRQGLEFSQAMFQGIFHAVSAFCNAGFALFPAGASLTNCQKDVPYLLTVLGLVITGGLGFLVLHNLSRYKFWHRDRRARGRITIHSRMVLTATVILILGGWLAFALLEWNHALGNLSGPHKILNALFHAVTPRTAGFNSISTVAISEPGRLLTMVLMFIGGAPGSTAGGIKTTTMIVLLLTIVAMIRGRHVTLYRQRAIPETIVREAIVIFLLAIFFISAAYAGLLLTETSQSNPNTGIPLLFETISAFGTVGLSLDMTPTLSTAGRVVIIVAMFVGRLGPLTIALVVGRPKTGDRVRFPVEEVVVG